MMPRRWLAVSALLCAAAALVAWLALRSPEALPRASVATGGELVASARVGGEPHATENEARREGAPVPAARDGAPRDRNDPPAARDRHRVRARIVDAEHRPLIGAVLAIDLGDAHERASSDASGEVECELDAEANASALTFRASAPAHASLRRTRPRGADAVTELGELVLADGGELGGRVLDEHGRPLSDARVVVEGPEIERAERPRGPLRERLRWTQGEDDAFELATDADGRFRFDGLRATHWSVWARAPGYGWSVLPSIAMNAGDEHVDLELVLEPLDPLRILRGRVVSPDDAPVADAIVQALVDAEANADYAEARTDALGRFETQLVDRAPRRVRIASPSWEWDPIEVADVPPGHEEHEFRFRASEWLWARVRDAAGRPVTAGRLHVLDAATDEELTRAMSDIDEKGRARLRRPPADFRLRLEAAGFEPTVRGPYAVAEVAEPLEFVAEAARGIRGRVLAAGRPVEGARVTACRRFPERRLARASAWKGRGAPFVVDVEREDWHSVLTDADGRFALELREATTSSVELLLVAEHDGHGAGYLATESASESARELELVLGERSTLAGSVALRSGARPAGWRVHASDAHGTERTVEVGNDGTYRIDDVFAGSWEVRASPPGARLRGTAWLPRDALRRAPDVELAAGSSARLDLVVDDAPIELVGELAIRGADLGAWELILVDSGTSFQRQRIGTDGRFRVPVEPHTQYRLALAGLDANWSGTEIRERVATNDLGVAWRFEFDAAVLRGRGRAAVAGRTWIAELEVRDGTVFARRFALAEDGSYGPIAVPAGRIRVRAERSFGEPGADASDPTLQVEAQIAPGQTLDLDLP